MIVFWRTTIFTVVRRNVARVRALVRVCVFVCARTRVCVYLCVRAHACAYVCLGGGGQSKVGHRSTPSFCLLSFPVFFLFPFLSFFQNNPSLL